MTAALSIPADLAALQARMCELEAELHDRRREIAAIIVDVALEHRGETCVREVAELWQRNPLLWPGLARARRIVRGALHERQRAREVVCEDRAHPITGALVRWYLVAREVRS